MSLFNQSMITCTNCGNAFQAEVEQILDVGQDRSVKGRLLSGQINVFQCPNCGFQLNVASPVMYHDAEHELLMVHFPMELGISQDQQEQMIGQWVRKITDQLPMEQRKGYLLNPRRTFTMQGMIDTVLEQEGVTKEMLNERQEKLQLLETFLQTNPEQYPELAAQNDAALDEEFFSILTVTAESAMAGGQQQVGEQLIALRDAILPHSSYGQEILEVSKRQEAAAQRVTKDVQNLGNDVTHTTLAEMAAQNGEDSDYLQVFASMMRPIMDYNFFAAMTEIIDNHRNKKLRRKAKIARDTLLEIVELIDQQNQMAFQQAEAVLENILAATNIQQALHQNIAAINDSFMAVLNQKLQQTQQTDPAKFEKLLEVQQQVNELIMQSSPPEVRFINELIRIEDELELRLRLVDELPQFGTRFVQYIDALLEQMGDRGEPAIIQKLEEIRAEAVKVLENGG